MSDIKQKQTIEKSTRKINTNSSPLFVMSASIMLNELCWSNMKTLNRIVQYFFALILNNLDFFVDETVYHYGLRVIWGNTWTQQINQMKW